MRYYDTFCEKKLKKIALKVYVISQTWHMVLVGTLVQVN